MALVLGHEDGGGIAGRPRRCGNLREDALAKMGLKLRVGGDAVVELIDEDEEEQADEQPERRRPVPTVRATPGLLRLGRAGVLADRDDILIDIAVDLDVALRAAERLELRALAGEAGLDAVVIGEALAQSRAPWSPIR